MSHDHFAEGMRDYLEEELARLQAQNQAEPTDAVRSAIAGTKAALRCVKQGDGYGAAMTLHLSGQAYAGSKERMNSDLHHWLRIREQRTQAGGRKGQKKKGDADGVTRREWIWRRYDQGPANGGEWDKSQAARVIEQEMLELGEYELPEDSFKAVRDTLYRARPGRK